MKEMHENPTEVFRYLRYVYLLEHFGGTAKRYWINEGYGADFSEANVREASEIANGLGIPLERVWGMKEFHVQYRITTRGGLEMLGLDSGEIGHYDISVLPLNIALGGSLLNKFAPRFSILERNARIKHSYDPYGIFLDEAKIEIRDNEGREAYIATRKFEYAALLNTTEKCLTGCAGCYKKIVTGVDQKGLAESDLDEYAKIKKELGLKGRRMLAQAGKMVEWLDKHPEVTDVIISGGEPLMYEPKVVGELLKKLGNALHLKNIRICTSAVFMGQFYLISDQLLKEITEANALIEENGKTLLMNTHCTSAAQIEAPEAKETAMKLLKAGVKGFWLQVPLQEGVNFWRDDLERSRAALNDIAEASKKVPGTHVYKLIVDMNSPSHERVTVPIETVARMISAFHMHERNGDMNLFQAIQILTPFGNVYINSPEFDNALKEIDYERKTVTYYFFIEEENKYKIVPYEEPLIEGQNDSPSRVQLKPGTSDAALGKVGKVRELYQAYRIAMEKALADNKSPDEQKREIAPLFAALLNAALPFRCKNEPLVVGKAEMDRYLAMTGTGGTGGLREKCREFSAKRLPLKCEESRIPGRIRK